MSDVIYVSEKGMQRMVEELARIEAEFRTLCEERTTACELSGDGWHDNPYLNLLQQREAAKTLEIRDLRDQVSRARVFERPAQPSTTRVEIGVIVELLVTDNTSGREDTQLWEIVGHGEGDRGVRRLSYTSPMGRAIIGCAPGDIVEATLPGRAVSIEIVSLRSSWGQAA
jgi:transcription elongation factor GreA